MMKLQKNLDELEHVINFVLVIIFFFAVFFFLSGCSTAQTQPTSQDTVYKYDISGTVNGVPFDGVGVIPYSNRYDMRIQSKVDVDMLTITSCHRDVAVESAIETGWFRSNRGYQYTFIPDGVENRGSCLMKIGAYNKGAAGQNSWGIFDFETPEATLPTTNVCNGVVSGTNGVSICQSRAGLVQGLIFPSPVKIAAQDLSPACTPTTQDNIAWEYVMAKGECVVAFQEIGGEKRIHRHTTVGYTDIQIRGN